MELPWWRYCGAYSKGRALKIGLVAVKCQLLALLTMA